MTGPQESTRDAHDEHDAHDTGDAGAVDLSTVCLVCGAAMRPEHAHYRCPQCGWRDSCCD